MRSLASALALAGLAGCTAFPGVEVDIALPSESPLSTLVRDQWMSTDRGIAAQVRLLVHRQRGDAAVPSREDLERIGLRCDPLPSADCSHLTRVRRTPVGPVPSTGAGPTTVTVQVLAQVGAPVETLTVVKTQD